MSIMNRPKKSVVGQVLEGSTSTSKGPKKVNKKVTDTYKLRQQSYYLDEDIIKAIEIRLFNNKMNNAPETDKSALVRSALSKYLKPELQQIKEKQQG